MRDFEDIRDKIMGSIANSVSSAYNKGYDAGYEDGTKEKPSLIYEQYEQGLNDGWECVKKFHMISNEKLEQMFGCTVWDIYHHKSAKEVMAVFEEYDKEFKVGDEIDYYGEKYVIYGVRTNSVRCVSGNGEWYEIAKNACEKTGRSFPEIADVMKRLKGDE